MAQLTTTPIVVLDYPTVDDAMRLVDRLGDRCRFYKVGSELFTAAGPEIVRRIHERGADVFLDLKFHDIPSTVRGAVRSATALGVRLLTVHGAGGLEMLRAAAEGAGGQVGVLAVTVLTSFDDASLADATGRPGISASDEVVRLAGTAATAGVHGIVCAGPDVPAVRARFGDKLALLVPGIRLRGGASHDQRRVMTPGEAAASGASYIVIGRAVSAAADPAVAMDAVLAELHSVSV
jgi:orotidine-5'-phosphate decarboxylase